MWPFNRKKKDESKEEKPAWFDRWEQMKADFPEGHKFDYLGRTMLVVKHRHYRPAFPGIAPTLPALICEYADELGVIHEWKAPLGTWRSFADKEV